MIAWLPTLACVALLAFLLSWPVPVVGAGTANKVALLYGISPLWGETDLSLRKRTAAASRSLVSRPAPDFTWWASPLRRAGAAIVAGAKALYPF